MSVSRDKGALEDIKRVVSGTKKGNKKNDILELTNIVEEDNPSQLVRVGSNMDALNSKGYKNAISNAKGVVKKLKKAKDKRSVRSEDINIGGGISMEALVVAMLKPQLSHWVEEHLPSLVNDIVEREIKKIVSDDN